MLLVAVAYTLIPEQQHAHKTSLCEYYKLRLAFTSLYFLFVLILDSVSGLVAHPMMGFIGIPKPEKIIEMTSGEFFTLLKVILCGLFQFTYFFSRITVKVFYFTHYSTVFFTFE